MSSVNIDTFTCINIAMKKSKYSESQIVFALQQAQTGITVAEVCRKMEKLKGFSQFHYTVETNQKLYCRLLFDGETFSWPLIEVKKEGVDLLKLDT